MTHRQSAAHEPTRRNRYSNFCCALTLALAACGGGGGGSSGTVTPSTGSAVHLVLDTAAGTPALVQAQVVGATLERSDGSQTSNLLVAPRNVVLSHPSGEAEGLELRHVDGGNYTALHLVFAPGTGSAQMEDGSHHSVDLSSNDLRIAFEDDFVHGSRSENWLSVRHSSSSALTGAGTHHTWSPSLAGGGAADDSLGGMTMHVSGRSANGFTARIPGDDRGQVHVEIENESELFDDNGGRHGDHASWVAGVQVGDDVFVSGTISQNGTIRGRRARDDGQRNSPRHVGRITSLDGGAGTFEMDVLATTLHGDRSQMQTPDHVVVTVGTAEIHFSRTQQQLTFDDLQQGALVKVEFSSRTGSSVTAREIDVSSRDGQPQFPESEGLVSAVDIANNTITVVRRNNDPLLVGGQPLTSVTLHVSANTFLFRKDRSGGGRGAITLGQVVPGSDRIWFRGTVTSPGQVDADWVRVRTN
jgi:hypothetical protein